MKTIKWKRLGFLMAIVVIMAGNLIGISALATEDGNNADLFGPDDPPEGVLKGYRPVIEKVKTGEHIEYWGGWVGVPFAYLVTDYAETLCCKKTNRAMDGCKDLKICPNKS
jgi:hypothetical protein